MSLPSPYVRLPNDLLGTPPMEARGATMHAMLIDGDRSAQQRYCDAALNGFPNARYKFRVVGDTVLVTAIYVPEMRSLDPLERQNGFVGEADIAFWSIVLCSDVQQQEPDRVMWLPSFMFVDSGPAMASGREIYGYPKCASQIVRASADPARADVSVATLHFERFGPDEYAAVRPICSVGGASSALAENNKSVASFAEALSIKAVGNVPPFPQLGMPQVMLRQYRDATRAGMAALKEVLVVTPSAGPVIDSGMLPSGLKIGINPSASHDVRSTLGLAEVNPVSLGAWLRFDFKVGWARRLLP